MLFGVYAGTMLCLVNILNVSTLYAVYTTCSSSVQPSIVDGVNDRQPKCPIDTLLCIYMYMNWCVSLTLVLQRL